MLRKRLSEIFEDATNGLSGVMRQIIARLRKHWQHLEEEIERCMIEIESVARRDNDCHRLTSIPGIGTLTATSPMAAVGNASNFRKGRELAAWLGLVPRQYDAPEGSRHSWASPSKVIRMCDSCSYMARDLWCSIYQRDKHELGAWITRLEQRAHRNVVVVAVANKLARIAWAVLAKQETYQPVRRHALIRE